MNVLLITPPMVQINSPYPAVPRLSAFLRAKGIAVAQADASLLLALHLFSPEGIARIARELTLRPAKLQLSGRTFLAQATRYQAIISPLLQFLRGHDPALAYRIVNSDFLPKGARFAWLENADEDPLLPAFGSLGIQDRARYLAGLVLEDLTDVIRENLAPEFDLARYGERLAISAPSFDPLEAALKAPQNLVDRQIDDIALKLARQHRPGLVGFSLPFPGTVYAAFRMAQVFKQQRPAVSVVFGGGYPSTEWRHLSDPRVFQYVDHIVLDDGELPLLNLIRRKQKTTARIPLIHTFSAPSSTVAYHEGPARHVPHGRLPTPDFSTLKSSHYIPFPTSLNPMLRLWSDGQWNKLTLAQGCYWHRCRFCDTSLDYIRRYDPAPIPRILRWIEDIREATGQNAFHFVDEAAPPTLLGLLADAILHRGLTLSWWVNIRFDPGFTPALVRRMSAAGCIAVSGGLEAAEKRCNTLLNKGFALDSAVRVIDRFAQAGILTHAYLMYGIPTQTTREVIDALELVRQLFAAGSLHSAFWHRFALTVHSPLAQSLHPLPGITVLPPAPGGFSRNECGFVDETGTDFDTLGQGLQRALLNYLHGLELERPLRQWFTRPIPRASIGPQTVQSWLKRR
jgi:radical SAM superfamily enzyme YgiQ (UPF0313 family)